MRHSDLVEVKISIGKGRGVFALAPIKKGQTIEHVPVVIIPADSLVNGLYNPTLGRYYYYWGRNKIAVALGYGSIYNHSFSANATYSYGRASIIYIATRNIKKGEEILINYNWDKSDRADVGFKVVE